MNGAETLSVLSSFYQSERLVATVPNGQSFQVLGEDWERWALAFVAQPTITFCVSPFQFLAPNRGFNITAAMSPVIFLYKDWPANLGGNWFVYQTSGGPMDIEFIITRKVR